MFPSSRFFTWMHAWYALYIISWLNFLIIDISFLIWSREEWGMDVHQIKWSKLICCLFRFRVWEKCSDPSSLIYRALSSPVFVLQRWSFCYGILVQCNEIKPARSSELLSVLSWERSCQACMIIPYKFKFNLRRCLVMYEQGLWLVCIKKLFLVKLFVRHIMFVPVLAPTQSEVKLSLVATHGTEKMMTKMPLYIEPQLPCAAPMYMFIPRKNW